MMSFPSKDFMKYAGLFLGIFCYFVASLWMDYERNEWFTEEAYLTLKDQVLIFIGPRVFFKNIVFPICGALLLSFLVSKINNLVSGLALASCVRCGWKGPFWKAQAAYGCPHCGSGNFNVVDVVHTKLVYTKHPRR